MTNQQTKNFNQLSLMAKGKGAFLGSAIGDALGWPQEMPWNRIDNSKNSIQDQFSNKFQQWTRKAGGKYYTHEEIIFPGEYSDDTQLFLATARSLDYGEQWWYHWTKRELPTWTRYERGGGGATKRAAQQWLTGQEPWSCDQKNTKAYFEAGGNGVVMRILPHCLINAREKNFDKIAKDIIANGVATHGHPRALVGALAYGFAVWLAFQQTETLQYGAILEEVLSEVSVWSVLPDISQFAPQWKFSANKYTGDYDNLWQTTVQEIVHLLKLCQLSMKQGALSIEQETLSQLGCFEKNSKGSGTVTATAAIFITSRYAVDPFHGLIQAAFADGADTDTLAAVTGGLLGAIAGVEWLSDYTNQVQDTIYIQQLAEHLATNQDKFSSKKASESQVKRRLISLFLEAITTSEIGSNIEVPDGRNAQIVSNIKHLSYSPNNLIETWKILTDDGQFLYIKKMSKLKSSNHNMAINYSYTISTSTVDLQKRPNGNKLQSLNVVKTAVKIPVLDLKKARFFYENILGLKVDKELKELVRYDGIVLFSSTKNNSITIYLEVDSLDAAYQNVCYAESKILKNIHQIDGRRRFTCLDPSGNEVEIIEVDF